MRVFCTGITGAGEDDYLAKFADYCREKGRDITIYHAGDIMFKHLQDVGVKYDWKRILNVPYQTRKIAVGGAFEKIISDMQDKENVLINSHSKFLWKKTVTRANSWHYIKKVDPDIFVTFIDAEWRIRQRLERKGTYNGQDLTDEDILMWQNNEVEDTAGWAEIMGKPHYVFSSWEPPSLLYKLMFERHKELVYAAFPMSFIKSKKDVEDIDNFVRDLRKYFAVISPRSIEIGTSGSYATSMHTIHRDLNWYLGPETKIIIAYFPKIVFTKGVSDEIKQAHDDTKKVWWIFPTKDYGPFEDFNKDRIFYSKDEFFKFVEKYARERDRLLKKTGVTIEKLPKYFDHTLLDNNAEEKEIVDICNEAKQYGFKSVCVMPKHITLARKCLEGSGVLVCSVVDFPRGDSTILKKVEDARHSISLGAAELDMVINIKRAMKKDYDCIRHEALEFLKLCKIHNITAKFILESSYIGKANTARCCKEIKKAAISLGIRLDMMFVKTSTGKCVVNGRKYGAEYSDVELMKSIVAPFRVKAAGGIGTLEKFLGMIDSGADRIGASKSVKIIEEFQSGNY